MQVKIIKRRATRRARTTRRPNTVKRSTYTRTRTNAAVVQALGNLSTTLPGRRPVSMYEMCRLNPFDGHGNAAIPDGSNSNFIVSDTFAVSVIKPTAAGQDIVIQTLPTMPILACVGSTTNFNVDGVNMTALSEIGWNSTSTTLSWVPCCVPPQFAGSHDPGVNLIDPWNSTGYRFISIAYRLIYTGPVNTCAGSITVTPNNVTFSTGPVTNTGNGMTLNTQSATNVVTALTTNIPTLVIDVSNNTSVMQRSSRTYRPEQGCIVRATHSGTSHQRLASPATSYGVITPQSIGQATNAYNVFRNTSSCGIICYDNDWTGYQISIQGMNSDASYRLEAVMCFEVNPSVQSAFYPMTRKESPNDPIALDAGKQAAQRQQISEGNKSGGRR